MCGCSSYNGNCYSKSIACVCGCSKCCGCYLCRGFGKLYRKRCKYLYMEYIGNHAKHYLSPALTTTYSVIGTSTARCTNPTPETVTVTVNPLPTYTLTSAASPTICAGGSTTLSVGGANTYMEYIGNDCKHNRNANHNHFL